MKKILFSFLLVCILCLPTYGFASNDNDMYLSPGGVQTHNNQGTINTGTINEGTTINGGVHANGGNANVHNTNLNANLNSNKNVNVNKNTNIGVNKQAQGQAQIQGQMQGQVQGQKITDSANNSAFNQQNIEDNRELPVNPTYQRPDMGTHRGPYKDTALDKLTPWADRKTWTEADLDGFPISGDVTVATTGKCEKSATFEIIPVSAPIREDERAFYLIVEAQDPLNAWGKLGNKALSLGASRMKISGVSYTFATKGSGWNIGMGGGFNAVNGGSNDSYGGSVGGGTGYGQFYAGPVVKVTIVAICYGFKAY